LGADTPRPIITFILHYHPEVPQMAFTPDPRVDLATSRSMADVVERLPLINLVEAFGELTGPCPSCGGRDRFSISTKNGVYNCRSCGGGDAISLVRLVLDCDFMGAVEFLEGARGVEVDPAEIARRKRVQAEQQKKTEAEAASYRAHAIRDAVQIWKSAVDFRGTPAEEYLALRVPGFSLIDLPFFCFRYCPMLPYGKTIKRRWHVLHTGPALISAVQGPDGRLRAVHRTWIDLTAPKGKAVILDPDGKAMPAKMVRGSKKGGAIRLTGNAIAPRLVMGEGIETTLTALKGSVARDAAYWAGVDLGNMAGLREGGRFSEIPKMSDADAFVPPPDVDHLIYIQDGDSEPRKTRALLVAGLRRAMNAVPGLTGHIVPSVEGGDLNEMINKNTNEAG